MHQTHVIKSGASIYLPSKSKRVILGIHGYTGYPRDLRYIATILNREGYAVRVPRLPGHATDSHDFLSTNARDWYTRARDEFLDLDSAYDEVIVLGFSMGGVIAAILAAEFNPKRLVLIAPAIQVRDANIKYTPYIWPFIKKFKNKPVFNGSSEEQICMFHEYWQWSYPKTAAQLYFLQKKALKCLPSVEADMLCIVSTKDETVPPETADIITDNSNCRSSKTIQLQKSPHVCLDENAPERDKVSTAVIDWLKSTSTP